MLRYALCPIVLATLTALPSSALASAQQDDTTTPTVVTVNGSGCDSGQPLQADVQVSDNQWTVTYRGNTMVAVAGANIPKTESRKNCQVNLKVDLQSGYTFAVKRITMDGSSSLSNSDSARISVSTYFQGSSGTKTVNHNLSSSDSGQFNHSEEFADGSLSWAPCTANRNLNLNTALQLNSTNNTDNPSWVRQDDSGSLTVDIVTKKC